MRSNPRTKFDDWWFQPILRFDFFGSPAVRRMPWAQAWHGVGSNGYGRSKCFIFDGSNQLYYIGVFANANHQKKTAVFFWNHRFSSLCLILFPLLSHFNRDFDSANHRPHPTTAPSWCKVFLFVAASRFGPLRAEMRGAILLVTNISWSP